MADTIELGAVERLMGDAAASATMSMSSTKSSIGHLLGAAGAVEAIFCVLALRDQMAPPTINLDNPAVRAQAGPRPEQGGEAQDRRGTVEFSFGFGGTNASLVIGLGKRRGCARLMWRSIASNALTLVHRDSDRGWRAFGPGGGTTYTAAGPLAEADLPGG